MSPVCVGKGGKTHISHAPHPLLNILFYTFLTLEIENGRELQNLRRNGKHFPTFKYRNRKVKFFFPFLIQLDNQNGNARGCYCEISVIQRYNWRKWMFQVNRIPGGHCLPNTSEGLSSSRSFPPLLVSYVANPPSGFLMLRSFREDRNEIIHMKPMTRLFSRNSLLTVY